MVWSKASSLTTGIFFILFLLIVGSQKVSSALGESCSTFSNCTGLGEVCIPSTNVCGCSADYYQANSDSCQMKLAYAEACAPITQPDDVCLEANTACIVSVSGGSYCLCTSFYYRSADDTTCSPLNNLKVSNILALQRTTTAVTLAWSANTSGTNVKYNIQTSEGATMSAITGTTATVTGLTPGKQYTFTVTTVLPADGYYPEKIAESTPSPAVWTVPAKPGAVTNVQLVSEQPVVVYEITFTASQGQFSHYTMTVNSETKQTPGSATTVTFTSLQPGQRYSYSITSYNGDNDPSEPFTGTLNTPLIGPGPVSQLAIVGISANGAKVKWEKPDRPNGDITGYTLTVTEGSTCVYGHINTCLDCATLGVSGNISHCQTRVNEGNTRASLNYDDTIFSVDLSNLEPLRNYIVSVTADGTKGTGESNHVAFRTLAQATSVTTDWQTSNATTTAPTTSVQRYYQCHVDSVDLAIPVSVVPNSKLHLKESSCQLQNNGTHHVLSFGYQECGTSVAYYTDYVYATNDITVESTLPPNGLVVFADDYTIPLECRFHHEQFVNGAFQAVAIDSTILGRRGGADAADFILREFRTELYQDVITEYPAQIPLNKELFVEIALANANGGTTGIVVKECKATPSNDDKDNNTYTLIQDGCPAQPTVQLQPNPHNETFRFSLQAFHFADPVNQNNMVYLHCDVSICPVTSCTSNCAATKRRRRRSIAQLVDTVTVSSGPYLLV